MIRSVGIVGNGAFGALLYTLVTRFAPEVSVRMYSSRALPDGSKFFSLEDVAASDAVVLSVPIHAFEAMLDRIVPHIAPHTVVVDVATVKVHTVDVLKRRMPHGRWIATHPMWGPESYKKKGGDVSGFRIVCAEHTISSEECDALSAFLSGCGFTVLHLTADEHDRHLAKTLFLTHYIGQIVARAGFDRTPIDTVSFGYLMDAVESVKNDEALFRDVFRSNPYCKEVLECFGDSEKSVREMLG